MSARNFKPRRSVLYVPGAKPRALEKALTLDVDAVILDLEDSIAPEAKEEARQNIGAALANATPVAREIAVRVNELGSPWFDDDLEFVAGLNLDAVVFPKIRQAYDLGLIRASMLKAGATNIHGLWVMIETIDAVQNAVAIGEALGPGDCMIMGLNDLALELGISGKLDSPLLAHAGLSTILAAKRAGLSIIDGVFANITDDDGFTASCAGSAHAGYDGKTIIHPNQVATANRSFAPSEADIKHARRIVTAFNEAKIRGRAVTTLDGEMIEDLHARGAEALLNVAKTLG